MSKYDKEREAMGIKPVASSSSSSGKSKYAQERESYQRIDAQPTFADKLQSGAMPNMDIRKSPLMQQVQAQPIVPEKTSWNSIVDNPIVHGAGAVLDTIGTGFDMFERATGLKNIGSAVKGLVDPQQYYKPDESHGNSYMGNLQNIGSEALATIKNAGRSAYEGLIHPDQTDQQFQTDLNANTANLDPVTKYSARYLGNAGTDPLTFIPIPISPVIKAIRGARVAAESGLIGKVAKDAKIAQEATTSKYAAEREATQAPNETASAVDGTAVKTPESNVTVSETSAYTKEDAMNNLAKAEKNLEDLHKQAEEYHAGLGAEYPQNEIFTPESPFNSKFRELSDAVRRAKNEVYNASPAPIKTKLTGTLTGLGDNGSISKRQIKDPTALDDLVKSKGFTDVNPETIAQTYNKKKWYHGTGNANLTADQLDPNVGNHESLFGQGVYLTDNPNIAEGYANSRGKRTGTPTIYETNVNTNRVLDLEKPVTPDVVDSVEKSFGPSLDYLGESRGYGKDHFTNLIRAEAAKPGMTAENLIKKVQQEISDFSHEEGISTNEFTENFQDFATYLKESGYDGITHTGGLRTGNDPHRVLIMLDPQNWHGAESLGKTVTKFEKYVKPQKPEPVAAKVVHEVPQQAAERAAQELGPVEKQGLLSGDQNLGFTPFAKKSEQFKNPNDTRSHIQSKTKAEKSSFMDKVHNFYNKNLDNLQPINQLDKDASRLLKRDLKPSEQSYTLALNSRGSDVISHKILTEGMVDSKGNEVGKSLKYITERLPKGKTVDFEDYLINKHAITRMKRNEKVFPDHMEMTAEKSAEKVAEYEAKYPTFKKIAEAYYQFNKDMGQKWLVDTGIISQKDWEGMVEANPYYVPNNRIFSEIEKPKVGGAKGTFSGQSNPIKSATGSQRKIVSPLESTIEHVDKYVKTAKRNEVMQSIYRNVQKDPEAFKGLIDIVEQPKAVENVSKVALDGEGIDNILNRFNENFEKAIKKPNLDGGDIVRGLVDGKPVYMKVSDPQLLDALTNLAPAAQNIVVKSVGQVTRVMKLLTTGANPVFSLTRNLFRDVPTAFVNSKTTSNPAVFARDLVSSIIDIAGNRAMYKSFKAVGGGHSSAIASDRNMLAQSKRAILPQNNRTSLIKKGVSAIENFNNALESAPRLGEFRRLAKDGSYDSKIKGLFEANDVTVNFNRRGQVAKEVDAFVPYMNAALQGLDKFVRAYKDNPVKAVAKSFTAITIPTAVLYAYNHDNPDYQKLSNYLKDNYFLIPKGDGTFFKIPKPREIGVPFGSLVERSLIKWNNEAPEAFKDFAATIKTAFLPPNPLTDTVAQPLIENATNKNFVGAPIVPGDLQRLSKPLQYDSQSSEVSKFAGNALNQSPKQIDHLIKSYTGIVGQLGIPANTKGASIGDVFQKQITADPVFSNDLMRDFYDKKTKLDTAQADFKATGEQSKEFNNDMRLRFNKISDAISDVGKEIKGVQKSDLPNEQKKAKIKELTDVMNGIAKQAIQK